MIDCTKQKPVAHYYWNLLIDDYLQLAENQINYCYASNKDRKQFRTTDSVLTHLQNALDLYHTVLVLSTQEMESITKTSIHPESVVSQLGEYSRIQHEVIKKIQLFLKQLILYCVRKHRSG